MVYEAARHIIFCEKDGEFPEHMLHIGGSCGLVTINGLLSIVTARHCIDRFLSDYPNSQRHALATFRQVGFRNTFALFKNIFFVHDCPTTGGVLGSECDLSICKSLPSDGFVSPDAWPLIDGAHNGSDPHLASGDRLLCYGFPDIAGPYLTDRLIAYNPCCVSMHLIGFEHDGMIAIGEIDAIDDLDGNSYPITSSLNGLSGGPAFRHIGTGECFSGIVLMSSGGLIRILTSRYVAGFARCHCC